MLILLLLFRCTQWSFLFQARRGGLHIFILFSILLLFLFDSLNQFLIVYNGMMETVQLQCLLGGKYHQVSSSNVMQLEVADHEYGIDKVG